MVDYSFVAVLVQTVRSDLFQMSRKVRPCDDKNSELIDLINRMDTLLQQLEFELDAGDV